MRLRFAGRGPRHGPRPRCSLPHRRLALTAMSLPTSRTIFRPLVSLKAGGTETERIGTDRDARKDIDSAAVGFGLVLTWVATSVMVMAAFWTTAPEASSTVPCTLAVPAIWAMAPVANSTSVARQRAPNQRPRTATALERLLLIEASRELPNRIFCGKRSDLSQKPDQYRGARMDLSRGQPAGDPWRELTERVLGRSQAGPDP